MNLTATPGGALKGEAAVPGDKSCSHRALILGALASGQTQIRGLLESDDVMATARAVEQFGAEAARGEDGAWQVTGGRWQPPVEAIDCGNSGTTARLLIGAVAGQPGLRAIFHGDQSLSSRPMQRVIAPLTRMGAGFAGTGRLPLTVTGARLAGIDLHNVPISAQVKSALLLAGLGTDAEVAITEQVPSRDHSEIMLGLFGCDVDVSDSAAGRTVTLGPDRALKGCEIDIAADPSSAAFPLVAATVVPGSDLVVRTMLANPLRTGLYETLETMGADISLENEQIQSGEIVADIRMRHSSLRPCHVRAEQVPAMIDEIPALAVACAFAEGESILEGLGELRVKESDRLGAIVAGLTACGVSAVADGETLRIFGRGSVRGGGTVATQGDHRIAMAFLVLGLGAEQPVEVDRAKMIDTSFPRFREVMRSVGARIE